MYLHYSGILGNQVNLRVNSLDNCPDCVDGANQLDYPDSELTLAKK